MQELSKEQNQLVTEMRETQSKIIDAAAILVLCSKKLGKQHRITGEVRLLVKELLIDLGKKQHSVEKSGAIEILARKVISG